MYVGVGVVFPLLSIDSAALAVHGANPMTSPPRDDPRRRCRNVVVMIAVDLSLFGSVPGKVIRDLPRLPRSGLALVRRCTVFSAAIAIILLHLEALKVEEPKKPQENGVQEGTLPHRGPNRRQMVHVSPPESHLYQHRLKMPSSGTRSLFILSLILRR